MVGRYGLLAVCCAVSLLSFSNIFTDMFNDNINYITMYCKYKIKIHFLQILQILLLKFI